MDEVAGVVPDARVELPRMDMIQDEEAEAESPYSVKPQGYKAGAPTIIVGLVTPPLFRQHCDTKHSRPVE
jgi:hypothetical protein